MFPVAAAVLLVVLTVSNRYILSDFIGRDFLFWIFDLAAELNVAVWLSGFGLFTGALLALENHQQQRGNVGWSWLGIVIVLTALSIDEIGSLHERVGIEWNILIAVALMIPLLPSLWRLWKTPQTRRSAILVVIAGTLFVSVAGQEIIEHSVEWSENVIGLRIGLEEGIELIGIILLLWAVVRMRPIEEYGNGWQRLIPDPYQFQRLSSLIVIGLFLHTITSILVADVTMAVKRGDGGVWFPSAMFFMLGTSIIWQGIAAEKTKRWAWYGSAALCLITSILIFFIVPQRDVLNGFARGDGPYLVFAGLVLVYFVLQIITGRSKLIQMNIGILLSLIFVGLILKQAPMLYMLAALMPILMSEVLTKPQVTQASTNTINPAPADLPFASQ